LAHRNHLGHGQDRALLAAFKSLSRVGLGLLPWQGWHRRAALCCVCGGRWRG